MSVPALHHVAAGHLGAADAATDGRPHEGPVEVELRGAYRGLGALDAGIGLGTAADACVVLLAGDGILLDERLGALRLALRQAGLGLRPGEVGLGPVERIPVLALVDDEEHVALLHFLALGERHLLDEAGDAGAHLHVAHRLDAAGELIPFIHRAPDRRGGGDGGWRRRLGRRRLHAASSNASATALTARSWKPCMKNLSSKGWGVKRMGAPYDRRPQGSYGEAGRARWARYRSRQSGDGWPRCR